MFKTGPHILPFFPETPTFITFCKLHPQFSYKKKFKFIVLLIIYSFCSFRDMIFDKHLKLKQYYI